MAETLAEASLALGQMQLTAEMLSAVCVCFNVVWSFICGTIASYVQTFCFLKMCALVCVQVMCDGEMGLKHFS